MLGTGNFSDKFKREAVAQITERGYSGHAPRQTHKTPIGR